MWGKFGGGGDKIRLNHDRLLLAQSPQDFVKLSQILKHRVCVDTYQETIDIFISYFHAFVPCKGGMTATFSR